MPLRRLSCKRVVPVCRVFYGRYWARTSDPQLVDSEQRAARFVAAGSKPPRSRKTCVVGALHGKEGVGGSSPPEGFAKAPQISAFHSALTCTISSMRYLWSPQVQSACSKRRKSTHSPERLSRPRSRATPRLDHKPGSSATGMWPTRRAALDPSGDAEPLRRRGFRRSPPRRAVVRASRVYGTDGTLILLYRPDVRNESLLSGSRTYAP
jgi:hypothetical protein